MVRVTATLVLATVLAGCGRCPDLSLKKGKVWKYASPDGAEFTMEIADDGSVNGEKCRVMTLSSNGEPLVTRYLKEEGRGIRELRLQIRGAEMGYKAPKWFLRGPAEAGAQFGEPVETCPPGGQLTYLGTFEAEEEITVPAGTFQCWRVKYRTELGSTFVFRETLWICEGVGIVKFESTGGYHGTSVEIQGDLVSVN